MELTHKVRPVFHLDWSLVILILLGVVILSCSRICLSRQPETRFTRFLAVTKLILRYVGPCLRAGASASVAISMPHVRAAMAPCRESRTLLRGSVHVIDLSITTPDERRST